MSAKASATDGFKQKEKNLFTQMLTLYDNKQFK
jgi:N-alpha-acetyltransferase 15/16, NatA auxiliary subunit